MGVGGGLGEPGRYPVVKKASSSHIPGMQIPALPLSLESWQVS